MTFFCLQFPSLSFKERTSAGSTGRSPHAGDAVTRKACGEGVNRAKWGDPKSLTEKRKSARIARWMPKGEEERRRRKTDPAALRLATSLGQGRPHNADRTIWCNWETISALMLQYVENRSAKKTQKYLGCLYRRQVPRRTALITTQALHEQTNRAIYFCTTVLLSPRLAPSWLCGNHQRVGVEGFESVVRIEGRRVWIRDLWES